MSAEQNPFDNNPFKAPVARVDDVGDNSGHFVPEGRAVAAGNGIAWLQQGWETFMRAPGPWVVIAIIYILLTVIVGILPGIGALALNLLMPVFIGGLMLGCRTLEEGGELSVSHLFAGFSNNVGNLVLVGVIYLVGVIGILLVAGGAGAILGIGAAIGGSPRLALVPMLLIALIGLFLFLPLMMAVWFAPALVIFHAQPPFEAMKASFFACLKNIVPFLLYGLVFLVLALLASIPLGLGWLVLVPVTMASMYAGYKDMFLR